MLHLSYSSFTKIEQKYDIICFPNIWFAIDVLEVLATIAARKIPRKDFLTCSNLAVVRGNEQNFK